MPQIDSGQALPSPEVLARLVARLGDDQRLEYLEGMTRRMAIYELERDDESLDEAMRYFESWAVSLAMLASPTWQQQATGVEKRIVQDELGEPIAVDGLDRALNLR
jgi:hypothetical protein